MEIANHSLLNNLLVLWKHLLCSIIPGLFSKSMSSVLGNRTVRKTSEHQMHKEKKETKSTKNKKHPKTNKKQ